MMLGLGSQLPLVSSGKGMWGGPQSPRGRGKPGKYQALLRFYSKPSCQCVLPPHPARFLPHCRNHARASPSQPLKWLSWQNLFHLSS